MTRNTFTNSLPRFSAVAVCGGIFVFLFSLFTFTAPVSGKWLMPGKPNAVVSLAAQPVHTALGSYNGVTAYSNGSVVASTHGSSCVNGCDTRYGGVYLGWKWQCVEYVRRFYYSVFGADLASKHRGDAKTWYGNAAKMGLQQNPNGGTVAPQPGDILTSNTGRYGHVAIIRSVSGNQVCVIQQNLTSDYGDANTCLLLSVSGGRYTIGNFSQGLSVRGWLRMPGTLPPSFCSNGSSVAFRLNNRPPVHPNGTLIKLANDQTYYVIINGQKRGIPTPEILHQLYEGEDGEFEFNDVVTVAQDEFDSYPTGAVINVPLPSNGRSQPDGKLIKAPNGNEISIVSDNGQRRPFPDALTFQNLGFVFCNVTEVDDYSSYPVGAIVTGAGNGGGGSAYPESPHPYPNFYDQTWTFTQPGNPASINVSFDAQTVVEQGYDLIYVTDGNGNNIPGSPFTGLSLAGQTKNVAGATVRVRLTSDGSIVYWGFRITNVASGGGISTPSTPSNLQAVAVSSSQVNLTWTDNSNNETGFKVQRKTGVSGVWTEIATVGQNVTSYQNTGLSPNTTYYYSTTSYNSAGQSAYSNEVGVTTSGGGSAYPESPHPYPNSYDQTWAYTQPGNPASINVSFDAQTVVEQGYDLIYVTDGNGNDIPGSPFTGLGLAGQTKNVPGATVRVRLTSDSSIVYWGFRITNIASGGDGVGGCALSSTSIGTTISGSLTDGDCDAPHRSGKKADLYTFNGSAGQRVTISMSSPFFDTYLFLTRTGGEVLAQDDDSGGGTNSRISAFTLPVTGSYTIEATSYNNGDRGSYTLSLAQNLFDTKTDLTGEVITVSAAGFGDNELAEESIASIFGAKLASGQEVAASLPLPTSLAGATVSLRDSLGIKRLAPLFFVSPTQINYQIPPGTASGAATVTVANGDGIVSADTVQVTSVAPGLFSANSNGQGVPAAVLLRIKADGSQSYESVAQFDPTQNKFIPLPIDVGASDDQVFLIFYGTGWRGRSSLSAMTAIIGGISSEILYAGPQEDFTGLDQLNLRVPNSLIGRGEVKLVLTVDGRTAKPVVLNFR